MSKHNKSAHPNGPESEGRMDGIINIDGTGHTFQADRVYMDEQDGALRFFGARTVDENPDKFEAVQVQLTPPTISTGTYPVGGESVKDVIYVDHQTGNSYTADKGEVSLTRSIPLKQLFGVVSCEFSVGGRTTIVNVQYAFKG